MTEKAEAQAQAQVETDSGAEELKMVPGPEEVKMVDAEKLKGNFVILWRNEKKQVCRIVEVDKEKQKVTYELVNGPDQGKHLRSRYDSSQTIWLFNKDNVILALHDAK